jgi:Fusaric acid resistance protein-like
VPAAWGLRGDPLPAIRRGLLVALPIGITLIAELEWDAGLAGGLSTATLVCGFIAFDAPARVRVRWQLLCAPLIGVAAALGVLSSSTVALAVAGMALVAGFAGYFVAVSLRMAIAGLSCVLAFLIAQGLFLDPEDAWRALAYGIGGGLVQAFTALVAWVVSDREREGFELRSAAAETLAKLRAGLSLRSASMRHALRFGGALALGVAIYRIAGFDNHGYWVPLTILFVLKPEANQTAERIAMRAAGTVIGLVLATALAEILGDAAIPSTIVLTLAAALAYALLAIEYALFTTAITVYVVLLTDTLGSGAFDAAGERGLGTVIGIIVAALAFRVYGELKEDEEAEPQAEAVGAGT